jgi:hypothetical protein
VTAIPVRWLTVFLDFPAGSFGAGVAFWREVTGSGLSPFRGAAGEPAASFERERSFWTALTGREGQDGARSVRLGFERSDGAGPVTGRLGFSCDDRRALAGRHAAAGARILAVLPHQTEMADPVGRRYSLVSQTAA